MRWPFGRPLNPPKKNKNKTKKREKKNTKISQKKLFSYQSIFSFYFGGCPKFSFLTTCPKTRASPKNTIRKWVSDKFLRNSDVSRNGHFGPTQPKSGNSSNHFLSFFFLFQQQKHKNALKPLFYSVLAKPKKRDFSKIISKHRKLKNPIFAPFF